MVIIDKPTPKSDILVCGDKLPGEIAHRIEMLRAAGYHVVAEKDLSTESDIGIPVAYLACTTDESKRFLQIAEKQGSGKTRPLVLLLLKDPSQACDEPCADLTMIASQNVTTEIKSVVAMHQRRQDLQHQNDTLAKENAELKTALENQKRINDEVSILKNAIVRNVSHELKTPLLQVKSAVALIAEDVENEELVNYAKGATARLEALVKNITMLGSSLDLHPTPTIVRDTIEYAIRTISRTWEHRDASSRVDLGIADNLPPALADKQGLSTVIQLLLDNALKFSKDKVTVYASREEDFIVIRVTDHGIGIAKNQVDRIFETFYQIDSSSTRAYGGTGVGLAIVRLILDRHNTKIEVESVVDRGSSFSFKLPVVKLPEQVNANNE